MFFSQTDLGLTMLSSTIKDVINQLNPYLQFIIAIIAIVKVPKVVADFLKKRKKDLFPYLTYNHFLKRNYSEVYREALSKYYIPTRAQEIDPCNQEEIRNNNGKFYSFLLIPFFKKEAFKRSSTGKYY